MTQGKRRGTKSDRRRSRNNDTDGNRSRTFVTTFNMTRCFECGYLPPRQAICLMFFFCLVFTPTSSTPWTAPCVPWCPRCAASEKGLARESRKWDRASPWKKARYKGCPSITQYVFSCLLLVKHPSPARMLIVSLHQIPFRSSLVEK